MSFFLGKGKKVKPSYTGIQLQTSSSIIAVALVWGMTRIGPNLIWYNDFKSRKKKVKAGKGFSRSQTTYTYSASIILALCQGTITTVSKVFKDKEKSASFASMGFSLFTGTNPQAAWGYLTTAHPSEAYNYPGIAYLAAQNYDLGEQATLPNHSFEVQARRYNEAVGGVGDAPLPGIIDDFLTDPESGAGVSPALIDYDSLYTTTGSTPTGDSSLESYLGALGIGYSPALIDQQAAGDTLEQWMKLADSEVVWTGSLIKFVPRARSAISGNGYWYVPPAGGDLIYILTDNDFNSKGADPVTVTRYDLSDSDNMLKLEYLDRDNEYNPAIVEWKDQALIDQFGPKQGATISAKEICEKDIAGLVISLIGNREAYLKNEYTFSLGVEYCLLEPMDAVGLVDAGLGVTAVRITDIEEQDDGSLNITAEELPDGFNDLDLTTYVPQPNTGGGLNTGISPGPVNPPIIFEPPSTLTGGKAQVWIAVSGGNGTIFNPYWGSATAYVSADGGTTYQAVGEIETAARMGKTASILAAFVGTNPDVTGSVNVNLARSEGELQSVTSAEAADEATLSYLGGEYLSYMDADVYASNAYTLHTELYRGLYGSTASSHASNSDFCRLDENIFKYELPDNYIGVPLKFKFQSHNIWNQGTEDLSSVVAYDYTPDGRGFGGGTGGVPTTPTSLAATANIGAATVSWAKNPDADNVTDYVVYRATGASQPFGSATEVAIVNAQTWTDVTAQSGQTYTYFLKAKNAIGLSTNTAGVNVTPLNATNPFGFAFSRGISSIVASQQFAFFDTPVAWNFSSPNPDSQGTIGGQGATAPSAQTDFDIQSPVGVSIGTMRFAASSLTATFIVSSATAIPTGQPTVIVAPASLNGMAGTLYGSLKGTR